MTYALKQKPIYVSDLSQISLKILMILSHNLLKWFYLPVPTVLDLVVLDLLVIQGIVFPLGNTAKTISIRS